MGASGSQRGVGEDWELSFRFAGSPNASNLSVGPIEGGELKQTKRQVRVLEVDGSDTSTIVETEECPE